MAIVVIFFCGEFKRYSGFDEHYIFFILSIESFNGKHSVRYAGDFDFFCLLSPFVYHVDCMSIVKSRHYDHGVYFTIDPFSGSDGAYFLTKGVGRGRTIRWHGSERPFLHSVNSRKFAMKS